MRIAVRGGIAWLAAAVSAIASLATAHVAAAQEAGESVIVDQPSPDDLYVAGGTVEVRAPVEGDVAAAGQRVRVDASVAGDALLAAERIVVAGRVEDDVRAAGRNVIVASSVGGHLVAAGESVSLQAGHVVEDWAWLAGQQVVVAGTVGSLRAVGETVTIAGDVRGDADVEAETIRLAPGAVVHGDLRWASPGELIVGEGARVDGATTRREYAGGDPTAAAIFGVVAAVLSLVLALVVLVLVAPRGSRLVAERARTSVLRSIAAGLAVIVGTPIAILVALFTGVLWIVGMVLLAAYVLALMVGSLLGVVALADLGLELRGLPAARASRGERLGAVVLAAILIAGLSFVPVLGPIVLALLTIVGVGALALSGWRVRRESARTELRVREPLPA